MPSASNTRSLFSEHSWIRDLKTRRYGFLNTLNKVVPWDELLAELVTLYPNGKRGRKPIPLESMLRLHVYQLCFDLSDLQAVDDMLENRVVEAFCEWDITQRQSLDRSTLTRFRHRLVAHDRSDWLKEVVVRSLEEARLVTPRGKRGEAAVRHPSGLPSTRKSRG